MRNAAEFLREPRQHSRRRFRVSPLVGGVTYEDAFSQLDGLEVYAFTWTGKYDELLRSSELSAFTIRNDDDRPGRAFLW